MSCSSRHLCCSCCRSSLCHVGSRSSWMAEKATARRVTAISSLAWVPQSMAITACNEVWTSTPPETPYANTQHFYQQHHADRCQLSTFTSWSWTFTCSADETNPSVGGAENWARLILAEAEPWGHRCPPGEFVFQPGFGHSTSAGKGWDAEGEKASLWKRQ